MKANFKIYLLFTAKAVRVTNGCNCGILAQIYIFLFLKRNKLWVVVLLLFFISYGTVHYKRKKKSPLLF
jgi:hypothetical protein